MKTINKGRQRVTAIKLECRTCGRTMDYDRGIDPTIPDCVVRITQPSCDKCWNGDFEDESWLDAAGKEVSQISVPRG